MKQFCHYVYLMQNFFGILMIGITTNLKYLITQYLNNTKLLNG